MRSLGGAGNAGEGSRTASAQRRRRGRIAWVLAWPALIGLLLTIAACGRKQPTPKVADNPVLAEVGKYKITRRDFDRRLGQLDESLRKNFNTPEKQAQFLQTLVEEKLILLAAEKKGLEREPEVQELLEDRRSQVLVRQYLDEVLVPTAVPDSADVARYFQEHPDEFNVSERVAARQIVVKTQAEAQAIRKRLLAGEKFETLVPKSIDPQTRNLKGSLGYVTRDQPVRGLGQNPAFVESVLALPTGAVSIPLLTNLGYHVVKVEAHEPGRVRELAAVRSSIERKLAPQKFEATFKHAVDSLRTVYTVKVDDKALFGAEGAAEHQARLRFEQAQEAADPVARLKLYEQIVAENGDTKYGAQAQFMIGFMYADELKDKVKARAAFEAMIQRYEKAPYVDSTLVDSARWMLKNMDLPATAPEGEGKTTATPSGATPLPTPPAAESQAGGVERH
jgi:peptidyl-prolyl cis-trans isomerase C